MSVSEERQQALDTALARINKQFGAGSIMKLGDDNPRLNVSRISTGSLSLDIALGGGIPKGRIIEVYGPESSGKTLVCLETIAQIQKTGGVAAFIDVEHALDPVWASRVGVNIEDLIISQPDSGEQALEITDTLVRSGAVDLIVVDSVAALVSQKELDGDMGDAHVGLVARLMSQGLRKMTGAANTTQTTIIFINQLREKIGVMFGNPETTTGGKALQFYASVRIDVRKGQAIKEGDAVVGNITKFKIVKNKVSSPFRIAEVSIYNYTNGIAGFSAESDILNQAVEYGIVKKAGSWFTYDKTQLGQGAERARQYLVENPELTQEIARLVNEKVFGVEESETSDLDSIVPEKD